ncbi:glycosyltransferase family 2 protein [Kaistia adipata]|uniref:glycosyltransferase family 2 protein n=1 Tax=Kaistia adipata TaxID=166954 RepID=UPI0004080583|nr:glycosyltransferase family 2 protein [Kaistia adipata]
MDVGEGDNPRRDDPDEALRYARLAARLGVEFDPSPRKSWERATAVEGGGSTSGIADAIRNGGAARIEDGNTRRLLVAPTAEMGERLEAVLQRRPELADGLVVTLPAVIRQSLTETAGPRLVWRAVNWLDRNFPELSARRLLTRGQMIAGIVLVLLIAVAGWAGGWMVLAGFNLVAGLFFLALVLLRLLAVSVVLERSRRAPPPLDVDRETLPVYSILVPLYDEAHMVPELARALGRLDWPKDRLDIKFIVEACDPTTRLAIERLGLGPPFEMLVVPECMPRTKPKALSFALPLARGRFVTVYDAEDRPDPGQLLEAYLAFAAEDERLACVQAPLLIDNGDANVLTAFFAMEYSMQFDGVLPMLAAFDMPLPLGGTSNHFRTRALKAVGGWDPHNVTEDADLGVRFARFGYRTGTITRPTCEEAPHTLKLWLKQRTRWLKGWMQTSLVHSRQPRRLWRELGPRRTLGFLLTGFGGVLAAALHPLYIGTTLGLLIDPSALWRAGTPLVSAMMFLNVFNFVAAYVAFVVLSGATLRLRRSRRRPAVLLLLPAYWLLLSLACYRALLQLIVAPHRWEKTRHRGHRSRRPFGASEPVRAAARSLA